ncbi:MAG TPA: 2-phosphosulfolactate phosphatase [Gemmatimonadaceae bacterium]|nr:2-phosphosulfolactate phosphatase [Gemmatimonadaceae bacterium]
MRNDVHFGVQVMGAADVHDRVVAVIDVLRASSTIAVALANGARTVIPFDSPDEAVLRSKAFDRSEVRLAGERKMHVIPGFDLGNSPREHTPEAVEGRTVLFATTNGTGALLAVQGAREVVVASFVNFAAVLTMLRAAVRGGSDVAIVCAGRERQFSLEDSACAGRYVKHVLARAADAELNDAARAALAIEAEYGDEIERMFQASTHGRALMEAGYGEDLAVCAALDAYPVIPLFQDRQITKLGPERGR